MPLRRETWEESSNSCAGFSRCSSTRRRFCLDRTPELFADEYRKLLERARSVYPEAPILCTVGPLLNDADLTAARAGIAAGVAAFEASGGSNARVWEMNVPNANPGCDYHPGLATRQAMVDALIPELRPLFG